MEAAAAAAGVTSHGAPVVVPETTAPVAIGGVATSGAGLASECCDVRRACGSIQRLPTATGATPQPRHIAIRTRGGAACAATATERHAARHYDQQAAPHFVTPHHAHRRVHLREQQGPRVALRHGCTQRGQTAGCLCVGHSGGAVVLITAQPDQRGLVCAAVREQHTQRRSEPHSDALVCACEVPGSRRGRRYTHTGHATT